MITEQDYVYEQTILVPYENQMRLEVWVGDCQYIDKWNKSDAYSFSFYPQTMVDHQNLLELVETAVSKVELGKDRFSRKQGRKLCENKDGSLYCSQLFLPKVNVQYENTEQLLGKPASISLHCRDLPLGQVVLQVEYLDLYESVEFPDNKTYNEQEIVGCIDDW